MRTLKQGLTVELVREVTGSQHCATQDIQKEDHSERSLFPAQET